MALNNQLQARLKEADQQFQSHLNLLVEQQFRQWCDREIDSIRKQQMEMAIRQAQTQLQVWRIEQEKVIRKDAITRSQAIIAGKVSEQLTPYLPCKAYNPTYARFLGSPIDFLIFDGLDEGKLRQIVFIEVKSGNCSMLSHRQKQIKEAIAHGLIKWQEIRLASPLYKS